MPVGFSMWQLENKNTWGLRIYDMMTHNAAYIHQLFGIVLLPYNENKMINHVCVAVSQISSWKFPNSGGNVFSKLVYWEVKYFISDLSLYQRDMPKLMWWFMHLSLSCLESFSPCIVFWFRDKFWLHWNQWNIFH